MFLQPRKLIVDGLIPIIKESENNYQHLISLTRKCLKDYKISPFRWTYIKLVPLYPLDHRIKGIDILGLGKGYSLFNILNQSPQTIKVKGVLGRETSDGTLDGNTVSINSIDHITTNEINNVLKQLVGERNFGPVTYDQSSNQFLPNTSNNLEKRSHMVPISSNYMHIKSFKLSESCKLPKIDLDITFTGSPQIQSLTNKIGELLGVGACISKATRTHFGPFNMDNALLESKLTPENVVQALERYKYSFMTKVLEESQSTSTLLCDQDEMPNEMHDRNQIQAI